MKQIQELEDELERRHKTSSRQPGTTTTTTTSTSTTQNKEAEGSPASSSQIPGDQTSSKQAQDDQTPNAKGTKALAGNLEDTPENEARFKTLDAPYTSRSSMTDGSSTDRTAGGLTSLVVTDEEAAEQNRHHYEYPEIHALCAMQFGMSLGYIAYTMTAWLYLGTIKEELFPDCDHVWSEPFLRWGCETTVLAFWMFPLFCCFFLLCFFYRDLLCTRLYYEMLAHNVFLDFENVDFTQSSAVRLMLVWMFVALLMYPMSGVVFSWRKLKLTITYWLPLLSFVGLLYASWDLETRLLSLAKYVEREFESAKDHMSNSVFMQDHLCEVAFDDVQQHAHRVRKIHTTGSYIRAIVKRAQGLVEEVADQELRDARKARSIMHSRFLVVFSSTFWVSRLLYCPSLDDYRAQRFRKWFRWYKLYTFSLLPFLAYLMFATVITHFHHQHIIPTSWLTKWFNVENFLIVPVGPEPELLELHGTVRFY